MNSVLHHPFKTGLGIEIHRPEVLGALDTESLLAIESALLQAQADPQIRWVALFSRLPKAFCAGGDVRRLHAEWKKSGTLDHARRFFDIEYRVDQLIWNFKKPVIALAHGLTFGGGIGLIRGASHRVLHPATVLAMPEISIGLYPDVGATYFLQSIPHPWRELVAYGGLRFGVREALDWGFATHCIEFDPAHGTGTLAQVDALPSHAPDDITRWLASQAPRDPTLPPALPVIPQTLKSIFDDASPELIWKRANELLASDGFRSLAAPFQAALESLLGGSAISAAVIGSQLARGPALSRSEAFAWEWKLSMGCLEHGDFFEGVRSRLVDKEAARGIAPRWKHAAPGLIPPRVLEQILG